MRGLVLLVLVALLLSGCSGRDDLSDTQMADRAAAALVALEDDIGPDGSIRAFEMTGSIILETETPAGFLPITLQASADVLLGTAADALVDGKIARVTYAAYCSPERIVVVTDGFEEYGEPDQDFEARNTAGVCTGRDAEPLFGGLGDFDFADPAILTGHFDPDALELVSVEQTGKKTFDALYRTGGAVGSTDITVHMKGKAIQSFTAANPESRITLTPIHGERTPLTAPEATQRFPGPVRGTGTPSTAGYEWSFTQGSNGPLADYALRVYDDRRVACTGATPAPVVEFRLADGDVQSLDGWDLTFQDDGDGLLGAGDWALIQHPARGNQVFEGDPVVWDLWADANAASACSIPGPGLALTGLGVLAAVGVAARRR